MRPQLFRHALAALLCGISLVGADPPPSPSGWPTPAQIYAGLGEPSVNPETRQRILKLYDGRLTITASPQSIEVIMLQAKDANPVETADRIISFNRALTNIIPDWDGFALSVLNVSGSLIQQPPSDAAFRSVELVYRGKVIKLSYLPALSVFGVGITPRTDQ